MSFTSLEVREKFIMNYRQISQRKESKLNIKIWNYMNNLLFKIYGYKT